MVGVINAFASAPSGLLVLAAAVVCMLGVVVCLAAPGDADKAGASAGKSRFPAFLRKKPSMTTVLAIVILAWAAWELNHARKYVSQESYRIAAVHPLRTSPALLEVIVSDKTERTYALAVDTTGNRKRYVCRSGRLTSGWFASDAKPVSTLFIRGGEPGTGMVAIGERDLVWLPATDERFPLPKPVVDDARYAPSTTWFAGADRQWFAAVCRTLGREDGPFSEISSELQLFEKSGKLLQRIPLAGQGTLRFLPEGRVLAMTSVRKTGVDYAYDLRLVDLVKNDSKTITLDGMLLSVSDDLSRAANIRTLTSDADAASPHRFELEEVDLGTLQRRTLLSADDLAPLEKEGNSPAITLMLWAENSRFRQSVGRSDPCPLRFARDLSSAVWFESSVERNVRKLRLMTLDIASGRKRVLADEAVLPVLYASSLKEPHDTSDPYRQTFWIPGYTQDGKGAVVQIGDWRYIVGLEKGEVTPLHQPAGDPGIDVAHPIIQFSPSRRRAVVSVTENDNRSAVPPIFFASLKGEPLTPRVQQNVVSVEGVFVLEPGQKPRCIFAEPMTVAWIDDSELLAYNSEHCYILHADGSAAREVFSPAEENLLKDRWK